MKKSLFAMLMLTAFFAAVSAAEKQPGFSAGIIPTKAANIANQFAGILPGRPPFISKVGKAVCGEPFSVQIIFSGAKIKNGSISLAGKITYTAPGGKKTELPLQNLTMKLSGDTRGVFLLPQNLQVSFDPPDPKGNYAFELELTDRNAAKTAKASASVEYVEKVDPEPGVKAFEKIAK